VIVVSGKESDERRSQVASAEAGELSRFIRIATRIAAHNFIAPHSRLSRTHPQYEEEV
jgi:hypothetical protein